MLRRLSAALVAALLVAPSAVAASVHVRVEGRTHTIFGATEPVVNVKTNALDALEAASNAGEFYYHVQQTSFGPYVDQIARYAAGGENGWVFKVNGVSPPVGADQVTLHDGDSVLWYWASFDQEFGTQVLVLQRTRSNCYRVFLQHDDGTQERTSASLHVGRKRVVPANQGADACVGKHRGLVRATADFALRSNALP